MNADKNACKILPLRMHVTTVSELRLKACPISYDRPTGLNPLYMQWGTSKRTGFQAKLVSYAAEIVAFTLIFICSAWQVGMTYGSTTLQVRNGPLDKLSSSSCMPLRICMRSKPCILG